MLSLFFPLTHGSRRENDGFFFFLQARSYAAGFIRTFCLTIIAFCSYRCEKREFLASVSLSLSFVKELMDQFMQARGREGGQGHAYEHIRQSENSWNFEGKYLGLRDSMSVGCFPGPRPIASFSSYHKMVSQFS